MVKERPILFSGPMVQALLAGRKTQTRRVVKGISALTDRHNGVRVFASTGDCQGVRQVVLSITREAMHSPGREKFWIKCPYGVPGDRLWVRETWRPMVDSESAYIEYRAGGTLESGNDCDAHNRIAILIHADGTDDWLKKDAHPMAGDEKRWRPSIHMPRWASRITLEVVSVRVERVQDISEADAIAEGVEKELVHPPDGFDPDNASPPGAMGYVSGVHAFPKGTIYVRAVDAYRELWDSINGMGSWKKNPWVWVVEFRRMCP